MRLSKPLLVIAIACGGLVLVPAAEAGVLGESVMVFELSGAQEVDPVNTNASGIAVAVLNAAQTSLTVMVSHDVADASASHIHGPAEAGENAGVIFDLGDPASPIVATWDNISPTEVLELLNGQYYVNVHTPANPGGEIRGQIVDDGSEITYNFPLSPRQEVDPVNEPTSGTGVGVLNGARTEFEVTVNHDVDDASASHIHGPAMVGENAGVIVDLGDPASPIMAVWDDITPEEVFDLVSGLYYVNVHSPDHPGGEIRGQITNDPPIFKAVGCNAGGMAVESGLNAHAGDLIVLLTLLGAVSVVARRNRQSKAGAVAPRR